MICADILGERSRLSPERTAVVDVASGARLSYRETGPPRGDLRAGLALRSRSQTRETVGDSVGQPSRVSRRVLRGGEMRGRPGSSGDAADRDGAGGDRQGLQAVGPGLRRRVFGYGGRAGPLDRRWPPGGPRWRREWPRASVGRASRLRRGRRVGAGGVQAGGSLLPPLYLGHDRSSQGSDHAAPDGGLERLQHCRLLAADRRTMSARSSHRCITRVDSAPF